ncbi:HAMP domain-containing histidine kinase [candidate division KSB1 bacterium]|nr:HAMP domain-containing histidine kinase [candidate division KSB1 bacterium]
MRMILLFVISLAIVFFITGFFLRWHLRSTLDSTLGQQLRSLAATCATQLDADLLNVLQPGDNDTRTYRNLLRQLETLRSASQLQRIFVFDHQQQSLVDTDSTVLIGQVYYHLPMLSREIELVLQGQTASSILFEGADERLYKTALAPIFRGRDIVAVVAIEGSAEMLNVVDKVQGYLLFLGSLALVGTLILAGILGSQMTRPINKLVQSAQNISSGNLQSSIVQSTQTEIGVLARTMEEMRQSILRRDRQQQAMLASVAHEIRNPLGGIELFAGMLSDDVTDPTLKDYARKILREVQTLKRIIQEFLAFAKPATARKALCNVEMIFNDVKNMLLVDSEGVKIEFQTNLDHETVFIDPQHLRQIFLNLLSNAIHALPDGGTIFVEINEKNSVCMLRIADNGPGIPTEYRDRIFEPFFTTREQGTGLGLAVVHNLVNENAGSIRYEDNRPHGAVFLMKFPAV